MAADVRFWKKFLETLQDFYDVVTKGLKIYSGDSVVISAKILDRVRGERRTLREFNFTPIAPDPLEKGFSLGAILGADLPKSLEAVSEFEANFLDFKRSLEVKENELSTLKALSREWTRQLDSISSLIQQVDKNLPLSAFLKELPNWWADAHAIQQEMSDRNMTIETLVKQGENELKANKQRLDELGPWVRDVGMWGNRLEDLLTNNELKDAADRIYKEITDRVGNEGSEQIRRQLAGLLAAMMVTNADVRARADRMREDAERRRGSSVGPDAFELLSGLLALGSVEDKDPDPTGDTTKIEFKYERKEFHYYIPKPHPGPKAKGKL